MLGTDLWKNFWKIPTLSWSTEFISIFPSIGEYITENRNKFDFFVRIFNFLTGRLNRLDSDVNDFFEYIISVTKISNLSPINFVSNIRHQHWVQNRGQNKNFTHLKGYRRIRVFPFEILKMFL